jgi:hypothetical protein
VFLFISFSRPVPVETLLNICSRDKGYAVKYVGELGEVQGGAWLNTHELSQAPIKGTDIQFGT